MMTKTSLSSATWASPVAQRAYSAPQRCLEAASSLARDARRFQWHRHSCLPRDTRGLRVVAKPLPQQRENATLSLPSKFLIANPRLTLRVSPIRICKLKISNRKFSTISCPEVRRVQLAPPFPPSKSPVTRHSHALSRHCADEGLLATSLLIETPRLEITISPLLSTPSNFLIETKVGFSVIPTPKTRIQCGREGESA
jgi:hypothetical protein